MEDESEVRRYVNITVRYSPDVMEVVGCSHVGWDPLRSVKMNYYAARTHGENVGGRTPPDAMEIAVGSAGNNRPAVTIKMEDRAAHLPHIGCQRNYPIQHGKAPTFLWTASGERLVL